MRISKILLMSVVIGASALGAAAVNAQPVTRTQPPGPQPQNVARQPAGPQFSAPQTSAPQTTPQNSNPQSVDPQAVAPQQGDPQNAATDPNAPPQQAPVVPQAPDAAPGQPTTPRFAEPDKSASTQAAPVATPYYAGFAETRIVDPVTNGKVPVAVWYPSTSKPTKSLRLQTAAIDATKDGDVAEGRFGLIILSHGPGGSPYLHHGLAVALAKAGYVVAAPLQPGDNAIEGARIGSSQIMASRARLAKAAIDHIVASPSFSSIIDPNSVGMIGYSMGAVTALQLAGADASIAAGVAHCKANRDDGFCRVWNGNDLGRSTALDNLADPRVKAVFLMTPIAAFFTDAELGKVTAQAAIYTAENDEILKNAVHGDRIATLLKQDNALQTIKKADHFAFVSVDDGRGPARRGFDQRGLQKDLESQSVAFFQRALAASN